MISVRKEWKEISSDEEMVAWAKKWGALLMETWNNPIFVAGHTEGKKSVLHQLDQVAAGEYPDNPPDQVLNYAEALQLISQNLKVLSFTLKSEKDFSIDTPTLKKLAADEMAKKLVDFVDIDVETTDTEKHYHFNLVMVE
jgi:hypothetical protein